LQAAKVPRIQLVHRRPYGADPRTTQRLIEGPQRVGIIGRSQDEQARQINSPGRSGRRIKISSRHTPCAVADYRHTEGAYYIEHDEGLLLTTRLAGRG
jgi:hypothetical protein